MVHTPTSEIGPSSFVILDHFSQNINEAALMGHCNIHPQVLIKTDFEIQSKHDVISLEQNVFITFIKHIHCLLLIIFTGLSECF